MEKKIAIVTMWDTQDNYGQVLQCYALQRFFIDQGCDSFLIKTKSDTQAPASLSKRLQSLPAKVLSLDFWDLLYFRYKQKKFFKCHGYINRRFDEFRSLYIKSTSKIYDINELIKECPEADIYITGSDQVWGALSDLYFLNFAPKGKKRFSYAASFGKNSFSKSDLKRMSQYLKTFNMVTVRESIGVDKCKLMGIIAKRIIDPTGLLTYKDYINMARLPDEKGYILLYLLGNYTDVHIGSIFKFAERMQLMIKYVASQGRNDHFPKIFPSPTEWLGLIANAGYVITNSYHCCLFSVYFKKPFWALRLTRIFKNMNSRIDTLYSIYKLPQVESLTELVTTSFNYNVISRLLEQDRNEAVEILKTWIK